MSSIPPGDKNQPPKKPTIPGAAPGAGQSKPTNPASSSRPTNPASGQPAKPAIPGAKPPVAGGKPPVPASKPAAGKPAPTPAKKPAKARHTHIDSNTRQLGQKLVDLGYLDEAQLEAIYEDMRTVESSLAELVILRKLATEDQLLTATAEVHGMRVANLEDAKPQPDAIKLVTKQMAELYKIVPLTLEHDVLSVAMSDPNNLQAMDDLKNLLGIRNVSAILAPPSQIDALLLRAYSSEKEESITNLIATLEASGAGNDFNGRENSIDLDGAMEMANSAPVRKLINMVLLMAIRDHASDVHFEPFE